MKYLLILSLSLLIFACGEQSLSDSPNNNKPSANEQDVLSSSDEVKRISFSVSGDFDADGNTEELLENFISTISNEAINKNMNLNYAALTDSVISLKPKTFLSCENAAIPDLFISEEAQQLGLAFLKNEGDLNGDGSDELSFMVNNADQSAINHVSLMTLRKGKWELLYRFETREDVLPVPTKEVEDLKAFFEEVRFFKKIRNNLVRISFFNEEGLEEYTDVDLTAAAKSPSTIIPLEQRFVIVGDSVLVPEFSVDYKFDEKVKELIGSNKESLIVNVTVSALPAENMDSAAHIYYDDYQEELLILNRELTVSKEGVFLFSDLKISKLAIDNVESLNFVLTLNIWSGRKSSDLNIFMEDKFIYGNIYTIRGKTFSSFVEML